MLKCVALPEAAVHRVTAVVPWKPAGLHSAAGNRGDGETPQNITGINLWLRAIG